MTPWIADFLLLGGLLAVGWRVVLGRDLFGAVVMFLVFGLLLTLTWVRLDAVDVALAEAAVGVGVTGALLLLAYRDLPPHDRVADEPVRPALRAVLALGTASLGLLIAVALVEMQPAERPLPGQVVEAMKNSGVENPVTAVLLDFRAYDTLLEVMVLMVATWSVGALEPGFVPAPTRSRGDFGLADTLARSVTPAGIVLAAYLLWVGSYRAGGAFQSGAILAALLILLAFIGRLVPVRIAGSAQRIALVLGPTVFLAVGLIALRLTGGFLQYPDGSTQASLLAIEAAVVVSVALSLSLLCLGAGGVGPGRPR